MVIAFTKDFPSTPTSHIITLRGLDEAKTADEAGQGRTDAIDTMAEIGS